MSFRWVRNGRTLTSVCTLCAFTITEATEALTLVRQRSHDAYTCLQRAIAATDPNTRHRIDRITYDQTESTTPTTGATT